MFAAALAAAGTLHAVALQDTVAPLSAFNGSWYEIASYGSSWQRRCTRDVTLVVAETSDVEATLTRRCRTASGVAVRTGRLQASGDAGQWRASFAPPIFNWLPAVWGDFWVLGHDELLTWVVVGGRDHQRLAVLSRTVALDESSLAQALALARRAGFDVERLVRVAHDPDEWRSAGQR
jgi:apolipoprotein D and lipocalin family protein